MAQQFSREPAVRKKLRLIYRENLLLSVSPTKKGRNEIDESHSLWGCHYIKDKPVTELKDEEYLKFVKAKNDELVEINLHVRQSDPTLDSNPLLDELTKDYVFHRNDFSNIADEWNKLRKEVLRVCVNDILMPVFQREAHEKLLIEAQECVVKVNFIL